MFDNLSKGVVNAGTITQNNYNGPHYTTSDDSTSKKLRPVVKDAHLNGYHSGASTIKVPLITFDSLTCLEIGDKLAMGERRYPSQNGHRSCSFDLAEALELLPGQKNELLFHGVDVPIDQIQWYKDRYCGYLSRHALVLLAHHYAERIAQSDGATFIESSIGKFRIFEHEHKTYVHFDREIRTTCPSHPEGNFDLNTIRSYAKRQYLVGVAIGELGDPAFWAPLTHPVIEFSVKHVVQDPTCTMFLQEELAREWQTVELFSKDVMVATSNIFLAIERPEKVRKALNTLLANARDQQTAALGPLAVFETGLHQTVEGYVALTGFLIHFFSACPQSWEFTESIAPSKVHSFFRSFFTNIRNGHSMFRGAETLDATKLAKSAEARFIELFHYSRSNPGVAMIESQMRSVLRLHNSNNICLALSQGVFAFLAYCNAARVRRNSIEAPEDWIKLVLAQDSNLLVGAI